MRELGEVVEVDKGPGLGVSRDCFWGQRKGRWWLHQWIIKKRDDELV